MVARESQNLPPVLEMAEAVYRGSATQLSPADQETLVQRAGHFAAGVRFGLEEPEAMQRLHSLTKDLHDVSRLDLLLPKVLDGALSLMGTDLGNVQLLDPVSGSLWLVTESGFSAEFLNYFAIVDDDHSTCGRAAKTCAQLVVADVDADAAFTPHREIAAASGFRSVQSTPLRDYTGRLVGMISTHFRRPYSPPARDLWIMELYSDFAGEAVARQLGVPAGDGVGDSLGRAMISALLGPGNHQGALPGLVGGRDARGRRLIGRPAYVQEAMAQFGRGIVDRLFSVGLSLESARGLVGEGPAGDRVTAAANEVDRMVHDVWTLMFGLATDRERLSPASAPDQGTLPPGGPGSPSPRP